MFWLYNSHRQANAEHSLSVHVMGSYIVYIDDAFLPIYIFFQCMISTHYLCKRYGIP